MNSHNSSKRIVLILSAIVLVVLLTVSLAARVSARTAAGAAVAGFNSATAPPATVPEPRPIVLGELPTPFCWGCSWNQNAPLDFQVDLDLLAPLGDGSGNAATWFEQFARNRNGRLNETYRAYRGRLVEIKANGRDFKAFPGDDPLLLAAEPWVDQASASFYPAIWEVSGMDTTVPDLLLMIHLAKSWIVRGHLSNDPQQAMQDFRRAIRLGRLLRQDDATIIQDLIAIACIKVGTEAMYELAREQGDAATMTVAALVLADKDAMRQAAARRITTLQHALTLRDQDAETLSLQMSDADLDSILELIRETPERRFRFEGIIGLQFVRQIGTPSQQEKARAALNELAVSDDETTAQLTRRLAVRHLTDDAIREALAANH